MSVASFDEDLSRHLPLPLAKLHRRAQNAKAPVERHNAACYLWEASLKLLSSAAIACFLEHPDQHDELIAALAKLCRPALGDWWSFVRRIVPILAERKDEGFAAINAILFEKGRDDLPRVAQLDAAICETLGIAAGSMGRVRVDGLFDHLVRYRNRELGHGAAGLRQLDYYEHMGRAMLAGCSELLARLDVLASRRLIYIDEVRLQKSGLFLIDRYLLVGESARRLPSLERPASNSMALQYRPGHVYLDQREEEPLSADASLNRPMTSLHPLVMYDPKVDEVLFLNARRNRQRYEHLCYTTGRHEDHAELEGEPQSVLARVLGGTEGLRAEDLAKKSAHDETEPNIPVSESSGTPIRRIGEFELMSELGYGNMGKVYRAWQPSLGRQVALKTVSRSEDPKARLRFQREIRALGRVDHPHLVKIFTSGFDGDPCYYTMELVEGVTLAAVSDTLLGSSTTATASTIDLETWQASLNTACETTRRSETPMLSASEPHSQFHGTRQPSNNTDVPSAADRGYVQQIVELIRQVALAADSLHSAGVVHRDIKPGNIMVVADGSQAVLMDLGLAQLADDVDGRLTRTRQFVGTLRYASPEQVLAVSKVDHRSDVYSLGATLWEMLTLRPLFGADDKTPTPELMRRITSTDADRIRKYHPGIARDLESIVAKCLEKDPARRYQSAAAFAEDLAHWLRGELVTAQPLTVRYVLSKYIRRNRGWVAAAACVAALLGLAIACEFWSIEKSRDGAIILRKQAEASAKEALKANEELRVTLKKLEERRAEAVRHEQEANAARALAESAGADAARSAERAEAVNAFLSHLLSHADPVQNAHEHKFSVEEVLDRSLKNLSRTFGKQPEHELAIRSTIGVTYHSLGQDAKAEGLLRQVLDDRRRLQGANYPETLTALENLALVLIDLGRAKEAEPMLRDVLEGRRRKFGPNGLETIAASENLAAALNDLGRPREAEPLLRTVVEQRRRLQGNEHYATLESIIKLATVLGNSLGKSDEAESLLRNVLENRTGRLGSDHPDTIWSHESLATVLAGSGKRQEAVSLSRQAVRNRRRTQGADHPDTLWSSGLLAENLRELGRLEEAKAIANELFAERIRQQGPAAPDTLSATRQLAMVKAASKQAPEEVEATLRKLVDDRRKIQGAEHPETFKAREDLAAALLEVKQYREAESILRSLVQDREKIQGFDHPATLRSEEQLAKVLEAQGVHQEAETLLRKVVETRRKNLGREHPLTQEAMTNLSRTLLDQHQSKAAEPLLRDVVKDQQAATQDSPAIANALTSLGWALIENSKENEAEPILREALKLRNDDLGRSHWETAYTQNLLGACLSRLGRFDDAEPMLLESYDTLHSLKDTPPVRLRQALDRIITHFESRKQTKQAEEWKQKRMDLKVPADVFAS